MQRLSLLLFCLGYLMSGTASAQTAFPVRFAWGTSYFPDNFQAIRQNPDITPEEIVNGYYYRYIQCAAIPDERERKALESGGVQFISYIHFGTYLVAIPQFFDINKLVSIQVRGLLPAPAAWKLATNLREEPYGDWAVHGNLVDLNIQLYPNVRIEEGAAWCRERGMRVRREGNQNGFLAVQVEQEKIMLVAALPFVRYLELAPPPAQPDDDRGRAMHGSNLLDTDYPLGKKYNGAGVNVLVRDDGQAGPHIDFKGRLFNKTENDDAVDHADQVGGVVGGAGNLNPQFRGMATGANVFFIDYSADFQDETLPLFFKDNVTITNTSYSNGCNSGYTLAAQTVDQQLFENPALLHVFSAGNSGTENCDYGAGSGWGNITGGHKVAKNAITVASVDFNLDLSYFSSKGPASDGRLKPEIAGLGSSVNMPISNNDYNVSGGTSYSAPAVAGCLAQLTQAYKALNNGAQPSAALLKTALLSTATDIGNAGPDFKFGWGQIDAYRALQLLESKRWLEGQAEHNKISTHNLSVPAGVRQARIMIYWADPPADANAAKALINDLDLTITAPDGTVLLPWKLNPTPNAAILNSPAGKGRDSLNNAEQIVINDPVAGSYSIKVNGFEVPLGPQPYLVAWEYLTDEIRLTWPSGGESLVPGETARLQWEAVGTSPGFTLRYSTDNAKTWIPINIVTGEKRFYNWTVPNIINGQVRLSILRSNKQDTTDFPLSISPVPTGLSVEKVCPDSMTIVWSPVNDTLNYDVYLLGAKYMEIAGTTGGTTLTLPILNAGTEQWISVRASHPNGLAGRRSIAVSWPGGLKNCTQPDDVAARALLSPVPVSLTGCSPITETVRVRLANQGLNPVSGAMIHYRLDNEPVVSELLPDVQPGAELIYTFQQALILAHNGIAHLKVWSSYAAEDAPFNDTLEISFPVFVEPVDTIFTETFQNPVFPPEGWKTENPDGDITWVRSSFDVVGANGQNTRAALLNSFNYDESGALDYLYLPPVDLSKMTDPGLVFDLAHAQYTVNMSENLRIEVFPDCNLNATPTVIWSKSDPALTTAPLSSGTFTPDSTADWRREGTSLKAFAGQSVIIRFVLTNDYGNNVYLDNIGIVGYGPPEAFINPAPDTVCRFSEMVEFTAVPAGPTATYSWQFGSGASPASTATGPGPHQIAYLIPGNKNVRLLVTEFDLTDTAVHPLTVIGPAVANFTYQANGPLVTFTNTSQAGGNYLWNFGDGGTSVEANPVHTYTLPGEYTVTLSAGNKCNATPSEKSQTFTLIFIGTKDLPEFSAVRLLPDPTESDFRVELDAKSSTNAQLTLFDVQGRLIKDIKTDVTPGTNVIPFEALNLPKGIYRLQVQTESGVRVFSVTAQ